MTVQKRLHQNRICYDHVWYRLFRYTQGSHYGEYQIPLGRGYFIDLYEGSLLALLESLEKSQNRNPALAHYLAKLRFYQRWIDPTSRLLFLPIMVRVRRCFLEMKRSAPIKRIFRRAHRVFYSCSD